ncbi:MAG: hypothetical protein K9W42_02900 [Candidatus Heimdallarchaeota archaeon]|nr:hypothetical protein [Candidatus Heimdallarchaeota archaeon]
MSLEYQRIVAEELQKLRFCPYCGKLVSLKVGKYVHPRVLFRCSVCGEVLVVSERKIIQANR